MDKILEIPDIIATLVKEDNYSMRVYLAEQVLGLIKEGMEDIYRDKQHTLDHILVSLENIQKENNGN